MRMRYHCTNRRAEHSPALRGFVLLLTVTAAGLCHADQIDDFVQAEIKRQRIPGAAIAVVRDGKITKSKGYGVADLDHDVPVTSDTVFALASITKQFTATLIMMLVEQGKVNLDDEISLYLHEPPVTWKGITVRNLLNHTSGLSPLGQDFVSLVRLQTITTAKMYEAAKADPIGGKPGEKWVYSDVGYFLLGMVIEKVSGKKYDVFLRERILDPLGMKTARMADLSRPYKHLAKGYTLVQTGDTWETLNIRRDSQRGLSSHYGLFGTVKDLAKWDAALYTDAVIKQSSLTQIWVPTKLNDGSTFQYGFGWGLGERNGHAYHYHSGITGTFIMRMPSLRLTVIVLTNLGWWSSSSSRGADAYMMAHGVAGLVDQKFRWKPLAQQETALTSKAREAFDSLSSGRLPEGLFTEDAVTSLSPVAKEFPSWYTELGEVRRVELVDRSEKGGETWCVFRFVFAKGSRVFAVDLDKDRKVISFVPDG